MLNEKYTIYLYTNIYTCIYSIYLNTHYFHLHVLILEYFIIYSKCHLYLNI